MADDSKTIIDEEPIENIQDEESGEDEGNTEELKDQESAVEDMPDQEPAADDGSDEGSIKTLAYTAKTWKTNDVIEADNLNAIEKELSSVSSSIDELNTNLTDSLSARLYKTFDASSSIKTAALAADAGWTFGRISGSGTDISVNDLPVAANCYVAISRWSASSSYALILLFRMNTNTMYHLQCNNGTWGSWTSMTIGS